MVCHTVGFYMSLTKKTKSERHHWWPECVSIHWADEKGGVHWLLPSGEVKRARPKSFGVIGNGHFIKLGNRPSEITPWDQNFETVFQKADDQFPAVIDWLKALNFEHRFDQTPRQRFIAQPSSQEAFGQMVESLTSLAIRSPMTREACVSLAERLRGPLPEWERNRLITTNMRDMHNRAIRIFGTRGKATVIWSPDRELIYGDGFFHNLTSPSGLPTSPEMLVPITPCLAVLYAIPTKYMDEPRLSTFVVDANEAERLNHVVQIYSHDKLFYRSECPKITEEYRADEHRRFSSPGHIIDQMIHDMPGVPDRETSFDFLSQFRLRR